MLVCAWVKTSLNEGEEKLLMDAERICDEFRQIYEEWLVEYPNNDFIHPRTLNSIHKLVNRREKDE